MLAPEFLGEVEEQSYYSKLMLELRMNRNVTIKATKPDLRNAADEWTYDLDEQILHMTEDSFMERGRYKSAN